MSINLLPKKSRVKQSPHPVLSLGDRVRIIGPFMQPTNCADVKFEGLTGAVVALGSLKSDKDFKLCLVELDDSSVCGMPKNPSPHAKPCVHKPYLHMSTTMEVSEIEMNGLHPDRKCYKVVSTANVVLLADEPEPKNNDGRSFCFWCRRPTEKIAGFQSNYDFCRSCKK